MQSGSPVADAAVGRPSWRAEESIVITVSLQGRKGRWKKGPSRGLRGGEQPGLKEGAVSQRLLVTTGN